MGFKDILVHLDNGRGQETRLSLAAALARRHDANLVGIYGFEPPPPAATRAPAIGSYGEIEAFRFELERERQTAVELAETAQTDFLQHAKRTGAKAEWRQIDGLVADVVTLQARYADLTILGQIDPDYPPIGSAASLPESVLMGSGRPMLVIPYVGRFETLGKRVLVAWNATREAARAVGDALPLLAEAETVTVLSIDASGGEEKVHPAEEMAEHLRHHGIAAQASRLVSDDVEPGELLLSRAADLGSDLIVAGGYGHSRMRELILGGATRALLHHMTVPVLMSH